MAVRYGGLRALDDVSLTVRAGTVHALIGPNGAGKTTLFNVISGVQARRAGTILFEGMDLSRAALHARAGLGLTRTFQNIRLCAGMTVLENVLCGMQPLMRASPVLSLLGIGAGRREEAEAQAKALQLLDFVGLRDAASRPAAALSYGDQRRVEIARALACSPRLLLLDEPAAGMNPSETADLAALLAGLKARGTTILIVEHDLHFLMRLSDWMTVLNFGRVLAEGSPASIRHDPRVVAAYLGSGSTAEAADRPLAGRARVPAVPAATS